MRSQNAHGFSRFSAAHNIAFDAGRGGKQDVHLSVKPLPKHMRLLPILEEAVSKIAIMKARPVMFVLGVGSGPASMSGSASV